MIFLFVILCGCNSDSNTSAPLNFNNEKIQLRFNPEYTVEVDTKSDSITRYSHDFVDTLLNGFPISYSKSSRLSGTTSRLTTDSVAFYCYTLISDTATIKGEVTSSSYFTISINKGLAQYEAHFSLVSNWKSVSNNLGAFHLFLERNNLLPPNQKD